MQRQQNNLVPPRLVFGGLSQFSLGENGTVPFAFARSLSGRPFSELVQTLQERINRIEASHRPSTTAPISSGCEPLDRLLPERGFRRGTLVEYISAGSGAGATTLAVIAACRACAEGGICVVLDPTGEFYPPAAARIGMSLDQLIVVHPSGRADHDWAMDQALRCRAVAAVLAWPETNDTKYVPTIAKVAEGEDRRPIACSPPRRRFCFPTVSLRGSNTTGPVSHGQGISWGEEPVLIAALRSFRRWQLAVEEGSGIGLLIRPDAVRQTPSWADVRLLVESLPAQNGLNGRRLKIQVLRCRGASTGGSVEVEIDDETHPVHPIARLAPTAVPHGAVGA